MQWLDVADSEVRRLRPCLLFPTCPSHPPARQLRRQSRDRIGDLQILAPLPCSFSNLEWISSSPHPCICNSEEGELQQLRQRAGSCDGFRKRGCRISDRRMLELKLQRSNPLLPRTQRSALRNAATADTQSICGVARQEAGRHVVVRHFLDWPCRNAQEVWPRQSIRSRNHRQALP